MQHLNALLAHRLVIIAVFVGLSCTIAAHDPARANAPYLVYLPTMMNQATSASQFPPVQTALDRINDYRSLAGVQFVQRHPALITAAQNHAKYTILNDENPSAWTNGPHGEVVGKPGFTGQSAADRMVVAHFPYGPSAEVMDYYDDPIRSVDGLMATVFHRVIALTPTHAYIGYGHMHSMTAAADVIDFGRGAADPTGQPGVAVFPGNGQTNVPLYGEGETPSPLPPGANYPIGYPVTLQPIYATTLTVTQAELRDGGGALVNVYPSPTNCNSSCYALIPTAGLQPATTYTVHVTGTIDTTPFDKIWSFTTKSCLTPLDC